MSNEINSEAHATYNASLRSLIDNANPKPQHGFEVFSQDDDIIMRAQNILMARMVKKGHALTTPQQTIDYLQLQLAEAENELFGVIWLDTRHRTIKFEVMFTGTIDGSSVHPREMVKRALHVNAAACILAHNHPSGVPEPSNADIAITERLKTALALVDVRVLDHIIVTPSETVSLAQRGNV